MWYLAYLLSQLNPYPKPDPNPNQSGYPCEGRVDCPATFGRSSQRHQPCAPQQKGLRLCACCSREGFRQAGLPWPGARGIRYCIDCGPKELVHADFDGCEQVGCTETHASDPPADGISPLKFQYCAACATRHGVKSSWSSGASKQGEIVSRSTYSSTYLLYLLTCLLTHLLTYTYCMLQPTWRCTGWRRTSRRMAMRTGSWPSTCASR